MTRLLPTLEIYERKICVQTSNEIPKGNTAVQVNVAAWELVRDSLAHGRKVLDIPCGEGEWLGFLKSQFPHLRATGMDVRTMSEPPTAYDYIKADITQEPLPGRDYDVITSISGIVCFGDHLAFFRKIRSALKSNGICVITNDNHWTVRDRIHYLLFGTFKRFPVLYRAGEGNTQATTIMTVLDSIERADLEWTEIRYTSIRFEDLLWLPFACLIWCIQAPALFFSRSRYTRSQRMQIFPFKALYARHYLICAKRKY